MRAAPRLPSAVTVAAGSVAAALVFAGGVIGATRVLPAINAQPVQVSTTLPAFPVAPADADRYSGVAQVVGDAGCTTTLVDTGATTAPAYLLTAGHCTRAARALDANAVVLDQPAALIAAFRRIAGGEPVEVPVTRVAYATMRGTDLSVLELGATLPALRQSGIRGYRLASVAAQTGLEVSNIAVPVTGVDPAAVVLRRGHCTVGPRADLVQSWWLFDDVQANNCPGVLGGSSGSPLLDDADKVRGLITTTTAAAVFEVDDTPPVRTPTLATEAEDGFRVRPVFSPPELVDYRVKIGRADHTDCADPAGYEGFRGEEYRVGPDALPARVCVVGSDQAGNEAQPWSQDLPPR